MIQTLFPNNHEVLQDNRIPIHKPGTVQSWTEEHKGELQQLPWPAQSPNLNITEPLWSVLETWEKNRFPPPTSLKQHEDVLQDIQFCQRLFKTYMNPFQEGVWLYWRKQMVQHHINKEMCLVPVLFPLFCSTPVY
jgi:hypothetical protein